MKLLCDFRRMKYRRAYMERMVIMMTHRGTKLARRRTLSEVNQHPSKISTSPFPTSMRHTSSNITVSCEFQSDTGPKKAKCPRKTREQDALILDP